MLIAILSDIHANREAFDACLAHARNAGAEQFVFLGDLVGYGADPVYVVDRVADMCTDGAIVIKGNHDAAVVSATCEMNVLARRAVEWTREQLAAQHLTFLSDLPLFAARDDVLYVHSEASRPADWIYVLSASEARHSMNATAQRITFCGHVHRPQLYRRRQRGPTTSLAPRTGAAFTFERNHQWHVVLGAVGQPRDDNPAAAYGLYETSDAVFAFQRVAYDVAAAAGKIRTAGLPDVLAERLFVGR